MTKDEIELRNVVEAISNIESDKSPLQGRVVEVTYRYVRDPGDISGRREVQGATIRMSAAQVVDALENEERLLRKKIAAELRRKADAIENEVR
jgi:glycine cleavage system H lipoate-binding protein